MEGRRDEAGESLIEVLVAVVILGIGVTALLGGMATAVFGSALHRNQADVSVVMTAAAERVKEAPYVGCAVMSDYLTPALFSYPGHVVTQAGTDLIVSTDPGGRAVFTVRFSIMDWYANEFLPRPDLPTCQSFDEGATRIQIVTITALTADGKVSQSVRVVKRFNVCQPPLRPGCDTT